MNLICFEFGVMISIWVLLRFWYDFDINLIRFWYGSSELASNKQKQPRDRFLVEFSSVFMVSVWFWYGFDTILIRFCYDFDTFLIWFWYGFDVVPVSWLQKKKQKEPRDRFLVDFSQVFVFWFDFDTILIWFWYDFEYFLDMVPMGWLQITSLTPNWNHIKIITETISKS